MLLNPIRVVGEFTLHDDDAVREKLTTMTKWEVMVDDGRNKADTFGEALESFLKPGRSYRVTVDDVAIATKPTITVFTDDRGEWTVADGFSSWAIGALVGEAEDIPHKLDAAGLVRVISLATDFGYRVEIFPR